MKLKPIGELFGESIASYRLSMRHLIALEVLPLLSFVVMGILVLAISYAGYLPAAVIVAILGIIMCIIVTVSTRIAMIQRVATERKDLAILPSLNATRPYFLSYLFLVIISTLATLTGFLLFIIPGILVTVWFAFAYFFLILEDTRGVKALVASKRLVDGLWWPTFWRLFVIGMLFIGINILIGALLGSIIGTTLSDILGSIVNLILSPYLLVYTYYLYLDIKRAKKSPHHEPEVVLA